MNLKKALNKFIQAEGDSIAAKLGKLGLKICGCVGSVPIPSSEQTITVEPPDCVDDLVRFWLALRDYGPSLDCDRMKRIIAQIIECLTDNPFEGKEGAGLTDYSSQQWIDLLRKMLEHYCGGDDPEDTDQKVLPGEGI